MTITTDPLHSDPTIAAFLADGGYASIDEWMVDSDYVQIEGEWFYPADYDDTEVAGLPVDPEGIIEGAIEASGFEDPHAFAGRVRSLLNAEGVDRL